MEDEPGLVRMSDDELFAYWNRLMHLGQRVAAAEVAVAAMASAAHRSVEVFLERHMSEAKAAAAARALTSIEGAERRSRIALALDDITTRIRQDDELRSMVDEDWDTTRNAFEDRWLLSTFQERTSAREPKPTADIPIATSQRRRFS